MPIHLFIQHTYNEAITGCIDLIGCSVIRFFSGRGGTMMWFGFERICLNKSSILSIMSEKISKVGSTKPCHVLRLFQFHCACIKPDSQVRVHILYSLCLSARDSDNKGELTYSCSHRTWRLSRSNISDVAGTYNSGLVLMINKFNTTKRSIE